MADHALLKTSCIDGLRAFCDAASMPWLCLDAGGIVRALNGPAERLLGNVMRARIGQLSQSLSAALVAKPTVSSSLGSHFFTLASNESAPLNVLATPSGAGELELVLDDGMTNALRAELQSLRTRYQTLMDNSQNGVCIMQNGRLIYVNRALAEMLGYEPSEMIGMAGNDFVFAADLPLANRIMNEPWRMGEARDIMLRLRMKHDMSIRDVAIRKICIEHDGMLALVGTIYDVTDLRRGEAALRDYAGRLRILSQQVIDIQEDERRNLARELHDEIGQQLTLLKMSLEQAQMSAHTDQLLCDAIAITSELTRQVRSLSLDLRPSMLDDLGLGATVRWYASRAAKLGAMKIGVEVDADFPRLQPELETLYFRVAQEAITNALRHSGAERLNITLGSRGDDLELLISDDGCGFELAAARAKAMRGGSAGLLGMQERAGLAGACLSIHSEVNKGTRVRLVMPSRRAVLPNNSA